jgi:NADH-quinone oxidoreductase subunit L
MIRSSILLASVDPAAAGVPPFVVWLVPLLPIFGFLFQVFAGRHLPKPLPGLVACATVAGSCAISWVLFAKLRDMTEAERAAGIVADLGPWINVPGLAGGALSVVANHKLLVDPLTAVMILVVTNVGFLIHVYSLGYMADDQRYARFFAYLNLFTGFMLILVMGSNLLLMFVGWEGVGLCSYLLIGFWFEKKENAIAGMKAFIVNRVGDFGFTIGVLTLFVFLGTLKDPDTDRPLADPVTLKPAARWTVDFQEIKETVGRVREIDARRLADHDRRQAGLPPQDRKPFEAALPAWLLATVGILLFVGATGKSAQIPLYTWLPDAMAGPTPVSALIHAATMVTAGVYMIARMNFLFALSPAAQCTVATVGAATALFAGTIGLAQNDIKKVLAYSTVSQLGFMFLGVGVGAFAAGIFHLFTHAFFKACLFLGSGSVIHGMGGEQDIRKMGALKPRMPVTYWTFLLATVAIAGLPPFAGFFSKDEILWRAFDTTAFANGWGKSLWLTGVVAAACTAFYMTRLVVKTFHGPAAWQGATAHAGGGVELPDWLNEEEDDEKKKKKEPPKKPGEPGAEGLPGWMDQDESLLDLGKVGQHPPDAGKEPPAAHDAAHDAAPARSDPGHPGGHGRHPAGEPHESPATMTLPLIVLAAGSAAVGFLGVPHVLHFLHLPEDLFGRWLAPVVAAPLSAGGSHAAEAFLMALSVAVALVGIAAAWRVYAGRRGEPARDFAERHPHLYDLVLHKYKVDEMYDAQVVQRLLRLNERVGVFDNEVIDGAVNLAARGGSGASRSAGVVDNDVVDAAINAAANATQAMGRKVRRIQSGNIRDYLTFALVGGLFLIAAFCLWLTRERIFEWFKG